MRNLLLVSALASGLALTACGYDEGEYNEPNADYNAEGNYDTAAGGAGYNAAASWPEGTRIVQEADVYYRIDPGGERILIEPGGSTIVVEDGVRFRVDPDGTRVRIDETGAAIRVDTGDIDAAVNTSDGSVTVNSN